MKFFMQRQITQTSLGVSWKAGVAFGTTLFSLAAALTAQAAVPLMPSIPTFRTSMVNVDTPVFRLATKLPTVPPSVPMIQTSSPEAEEQLVKIAEKLGMDVKPGDNGKGKLATRHMAGEQEQQTLTVFEVSGGFFYRYDNLLNSIPKEQARLPDDAEAYEIALNFLEKYDLVPPDVILDPYHVTYSRPELSQFDAKSGKTLRRFTTSVEVRFNQQWAGIPVTGPGAKLYVAIGDEGKVLGLTHMLRSGQESGVELATIAPEQALKTLSSGEAQMAIPVGCQKASIEAMTLAFWSQSPRENQRTAIPLYDISGSCQDDKGQSLGSFQAYTAAVLEPAETPESNPRRQDYEQDIDG